MKLSTKGRYGLKAMFELSLNHSKGPVSIKNIAAKQNIPEQYLEQIFSKLKKANLITETKQKNFIFYELNSSVFEDVLVWIYKLGGNKNGKEK